MPPGSTLYSIDPDAVHVQLARQMIDHAGVSNQVEIMQGTLQTCTDVSFNHSTSIHLDCGHCFPAAFLGFKS